MSTIATSSNQRTRRENGPQPLDVIKIDEALLRKATVAALTGLSGTSVDRKTAAGQFPKPIKMGARCTRWRALDVRLWLEQRAQGEAA